jgi:hypothetical protein
MWKNNETVGNVRNNIIEIRISRRADGKYDMQSRNISRNGLVSEVRFMPKATITEIHVMLDVDYDYTRKRVDNGRK